MGVKGYWAIIAALFGGIFTAGGVWVTASNSREEVKELKKEVKSQGKDVERVDERTQIMFRQLERIENKLDKK